MKNRSLLRTSMKRGKNVYFYILRKSGYGGGKKNIPKSLKSTFFKMAAIIFFFKSECDYKL